MPRGEKGKYLAGIDLYTDGGKKRSLEQGEKDEGTANTLAISK